MNPRLTFLAAFLCIAIVTFGHAAAHATCRQSVFTLCNEQKGAAGAMAAIAWPLYWSWVAFDASAMGDSQ